MIAKTLLFQFNSTHEISGNERGCIIYKAFGKTIDNLTLLDRCIRL